VAAARDAELAQLAGEEEAARGRSEPSPSGPQSRCSGCAPAQARGRVRWRGARRRGDGARGAHLARGAAGGRLNDHAGETAAWPTQSGSGRPRLAAPWR
jgi:hypothetical protein